jgi:methyl-accepting chemotaxis protein
MSWLTNIPIRGKLVSVTTLAIATALLLAGSAVIVFDSVTYQAQKIREISIHAKILAQSVIASLEFKDSRAGQEYLNALAANSDILAAGVYAEDGSLFASYSRSGGGSRPLPARAASMGQGFEDDELVGFWPVNQGGRQVGSVFLRVGTEPLSARLARYVGILSLVMIGALLITLPISMRLHAVITTPIKEMADATSRIAAGDLTVRITSDERKDELGLLSRKIAEMIENLRAVTRQIAEGAELLLASGANILTTTIQMVSTTSETATTVAETTTTVEEVKQAAHMTSQKAKDVSESAQKAAQVSVAGRKSVEETVEGMNRIREQMEAIAESTVRLSEQSQAIGEIVDSVNDLAEQSNLLAVNAAIEAAKAGEQGKGFAVVAQEVKNLAEQSKQATAQVRKILSDIQKGIGVAVMTTEQGSKAVEGGVNQSLAAGESIRMLSESIAESAHAAAQIAASTQQQLVGMDQVALAMENIKQGGNQNTAATRQAEAAAQNLQDLGQKLKGLVGQYKL